MQPKTDERRMSRTNPAGLLTDDDRRERDKTAEVRDVEGWQLKGWLSRFASCLFVVRLHPDFLLVFFPIAYDR